jgi:mannan endo-1,4-beta-mannosidase
MMKANRPLVFPPVADVDTAVTEYNTAVTLHPAANDIAYGGAAILPASLDLDPLAAGQQATVMVAGGTFTASPDGAVLFTPLDDFSGKAQTSYTIEDSAGKLSNAASLTVTVKPNPTAAIQIASFETSTENWASAGWQANAGSVQQSSEYASQGSYSLKVITADGGWFGTSFGLPLNLTGKTHLKFDIKTLASGTSANAAIQIGPNWTWCQGPWSWINAGTTTTMDIDLINAGCASADLGQMNGIYVWFSGGGTFFIDNVRAE